MVYCPKCGNKNRDDAEYCIKCGASLDSKKNNYEKFQTPSLGKQVEDFTEEVEQIGRKAGKMIEQGAKTIGEELEGKSKSDEYRKLYRSGKNRILGGVCGGVAEYFGIDPILVRILWGITVFFFGLGIILYVLFWIFVPRNPVHSWN